MKKFFLLLITTLLVAFCGLLTACGEPDAVDQSSIKYDGSTISWDAVEDAQGYLVSINGKQYPSDDNTFLYSVADDVNQVEVSVIALGKKDKESEEAVKIFTRLPKIEEADITFDENGAMSWKKVDGADLYILDINGKEVREAATEYNKFPQGQVNKIRIKPITADDASFSDWSVALTKTYLGAPTKVNYDGQYIRFTGNSEAKRYVVYIDGVQFAETEDKSVLYNANNQSFDLQVQSLGDGTKSFHSQISEVKRFVFLKDIDGFAVEDGVLIWNEVPEASAYTVWMNGTEYTVETNRFDQIPANKPNRIKVKPVTNEGETFFANWSAEQQVRILVAPTLRWNSQLKLDDGIGKNVFSWNGVDGSVGGYNVKVVTPSGETEIHELSASAVTFGEEEPFLEAGEYQVSIQTFPVKDSGSYKSQYSSPVRVVRLAAPKAANEFITSNPTNLQQGFSIKWLGADGAKAYKLWKGETELPGTITNNIATIAYSQFMSADETAGKEIVFEIQSLGNSSTFDSEHFVTLPSLRSDNGEGTHRLYATINILPQPKNLNIEGFLVSWDEVTGAEGYGVKIGENTTVGTASYDLTNVDGKQEGFGVCSMGNGGNVLPSNYTAGITLIRLPAPENIHIVQNTNGDKLTFDGRSDDATRYDVCWEDEDNAAVDYDTIEDFSRYMTYTSKGLYMRAIANKWNNEEQKSIYYITSKQSSTVTLTKLQEISFGNRKLDESGNKLVWNAPSNAQNTPIRYQVYYKNGVKLGAETTARELSLTELPAGTYTFKVRAIANDRHFVSNTLEIADIETYVTITKLETPVVKCVGNTYTWQSYETVKSFQVVIDGVAHEVPFEDGKVEYSYIVPFTEAKASGYAVSVYAQGDGYTTANSNPHAFKQIVAKAEAPTFSFELRDGGTAVTQDTEDAKFHIEVTLPSNYTKGYVATINNEIELKLEDGATSMDWKPSKGNATGNAGAYELRVYATGNMFDASETAGTSVFYVKSETKLPKRLQVYSAPTDIQWDSYKFNVIGDASKYRLVITFNDSSKEAIEVLTTDKIYNFSQAGYALDDFYKVEAYAIGDINNGTISSMIKEEFI